MADSASKNNPRHCDVNNTAGASGFTLMELLVAMSLAAVVGMAVYSLSASVMGAYDQAKKIRRADYGQKILLEIVQDDLRGVWAAIPKNEAFIFQGRQVSEGGEPFLHFATTTSMDLMAPELMQNVYEVRYLLRQTDFGDSMELVREERAFAGVEGDFPWQEIVIVSDVESMELEYLRPDTHEVSSEWYADPNDKDGPWVPYGVKVNIAFSREEGEEFEGLVEEEAFLVILPQEVFSFKKRAF